MVKQDGITSTQFAKLMITLVVATAVLYVPAFTLETSGTGGWISAALSMVAGFLVMGIVFALHHHFPSLTIIQICERLLGTVAGRFLGGLYAAFFLTTGILVQRELVGFIHAIALPKTPVLATEIVIGFTLSYALYHGVEGIARVNDPVCWSIFVLFSTLMIGLMGKVHWLAYQPMFDHGWAGVVRGAFVPSSWFGELVIMSMILPSVKSRQSLVLLRNAALSIVLIGTVLIGTTGIVIGLFGAYEGGRMIFPTYEAVKYVQFSEFIQHIDIFFLMPWIFLMFLKTMLFYYGTIAGMAQMFGTHNFRAFIMPITMLTVILSDWAFPNEVHLRQFLLDVFPNYALVAEFAGPAALLAIALTQRRKRGRCS